MDNIYLCHLELHDNLYFASREIGSLFETAPVLHNYALCYALGLVTSDSYRYFCREQVPQYKEHLSPLADQGIYVTPAKPLDRSSMLVTWKTESDGGEKYNKPYPTFGQGKSRNIPRTGRAKEIAVGSTFEFFVFSETPLKFPHWIRLGKWASKAEVTVTRVNPALHDSAEFVCDHPLNPLDVMGLNQVMAYDTINMPPVSLITNVRLRGEFYSFAEVETKIPAGMEWNFG